MSKQILDLTDDLIVMYKGDTLAVAVGPGLRSTGWPGGQWVKFVPPTGVDEFEVEASDGNEVAGLLSAPSERSFSADPADKDGPQVNFTGHYKRTAQGAASGASTVTMQVGNARLLFSLYETTALAPDGSRTGGPAVYQLNKQLRVSENGFLCQDSEAFLILAGVLTPQTPGVCSAVPAARNNYRLGIDLRM